MKSTLKDKAKINKVFTQGTTLCDGVILVKTLASDKPEVLVTVSTKKFPKAVDRNRIKRLMRQAISKVNLPTKSIAVVYVANHMPTLNDIQVSLIKMI